MVERYQEMREKITKIAAEAIRQEVRKLEAVKPIIDEKLVALLEDLLNSAKAGKFISFAFAGEASTGHLIRGHCVDHPKASRFSLIGGLEYEKHSLNLLVDSQDPEEDYEP